MLSRRKKNPRETIPLTMTDRHTLATELAEHLQKFCDNGHAGVLKIHWDDCDMDERRFWFHFYAPHLKDVRQSNSKEMKEASKLVTACIREAQAFLHDCCYTTEWNSSKWDAPKAEYWNDGGRKYFDRYETQTWIKVLTFYGG